MTAVRRAVAADAGPAAEVLLRARAEAAALGTIPPGVHPEDEVRAWFAGHALRACDVWVAREPGRELTAVMVLDGDWIDQLYVAPGMTGRGIGAALLAVARGARPSGLRLWCFASNTGARRFYERHGFAVVDATDGTGNEERAADLLLRWDPCTLH